MSGTDIEKKIIDKYIKSDEALKNFRDEFRKIEPGFLEMCKNLILHMKPETLSHKDIENPPYHVCNEGHRDLGKESFSRFGVITLAGGSATRFFSELKEPVPFKSKALFPFTENCNFLEIFAGEILASSLEAGCIPPWLVMVSDNNADEILNYFSKPPFGFPSELIFIVKQGVVPRFDDDGLPIVSSSGKLSWTGNGHGGVFFVLKDPLSQVLINHAIPGKANVKEVLTELGVKHMVLHNVDNVFARPTDFSRLGFHISQDSLFTISVVEREDLTEKIGLIVLDCRESRFYALEYSFADPNIFERVEGGKPRYNLGHINTNVFSLDVVDDQYLKKLKPVLYTGKVVTIDGRQVKTNTVEFLNQMIVSELPVERVRVLLVKRDDFFLPTKSIFGKDSLVSSRERYFSFVRARMRKLGVQIPEGSVFELAPYLVFGKLDMFDTRNWFIDDETSFYFGCFFPSERFCISEGLKLYRGSKLSIRTSRPFGRFVLDGRKIKGFQNPPRVKVGKNVCVKGKVDIMLDEGAELIIRDGSEITKDLKLSIGSSQRVVLP